MNNILKYEHISNALETNLENGNIDGETYSAEVTKLCKQVRKDSILTITEKSLLLDYIVK